MSTGKHFTAAEVDALATALLAARRPGAPLVPTPTRCPDDDAQAYRVQAVVAAGLGRPIRAWKVGAANPTATPNCAPIFDVWPMADGVTGARPATGVELEIAFTMARGFPAAAAAPSRTEVEAGIGGAHVALETCASRLQAGMDAPPLLRLADFGINHGLVLGPALPDWRKVDLSTLRARVEAGGANIADLTAAHTAPDLVGLLTWLVGHVVTERGGMSAGTIVTTGSWSGIRWVAPPVTVTGRFEQVGTVTVALT
jgi:2-keto-4-pentenoate hydratase